MEHWERTLRHVEAVSIQVCSFCRGPLYSPTMRLGNWQAIRLPVAEELLNVLQLTVAEVDVVNCQALALKRRCRV